MRVKRTIGLSIILMFLGLAAFGAVCAAAYAAAGLAAEAINAITIPLALIPTAVFLIWLAKGNYRQLNKVQNLTAALWIGIATSTVAYVATAFPTDIIKASITLAGAQTVLWLLCVQFTRRLYRRKREQNIALAAGKTVDHPDVQKLANNSDLATSITVAVFATAESIILLRSEFTPYLTVATIRIIALLIGVPLGFAWFNWCPNQTDIREFVSRHKRPPHPEDDDTI